ncbi:MAG: LicD family protein [Treponema sp.]|nr:LicD family protein [Treponema sp.]
MEEKIGYISGIFDNLNGTIYDTLLWCKSKCSKLVAGVYSDALACRILDKPVDSEYEKTIALLKLFPCVDEVVEVNWENITIESSFNQIKYNVCFYGSDYGINFISDKDFCAKNGIEFLPLPNQKIKLFSNSLKVLLENSFDRDIVLFGTGNYFDLYMKEFGSRYVPAYAIDNNKEKWGKSKNGIKIFRIDKLKDKSEKVPLVIICVKNYEPIVEQLKNFGNIDYRTLCCNDAFAVSDEASLVIKEEAAYMKEAHRLLTIILVEFDRVCKKHNLKYFLSQGSLIGAVRHHGLIPWDDDVDVAMFREDYNKLCKIAKEEWSDRDFAFVPPDKMGRNCFHDFISRVVYTKEHIKTSVFTKSQKRMYKELLDTICLDIYLLDNCSKDKAVHEKQAFKIMTLYGLAMGHRAQLDFSDYKEQTPFVQKAIKGLTFIGRLIPLKVILYAYKKCCEKYSKKNKNSNSVYEPNGPLACLYYDMDKVLYGNGAYLKVFEHDIMVPEKYGEFLEAHGYTNYMEYPPGNMRKPTHSPKCRGIMYNI